MTSQSSYPADRDTWIRRTEWVVAILVTVVSVALHGVLLTHAGALWRDEVNSVNVAAAPTLSDLWRSSEFDSFPLLWPLILRGAVASVSNDFGLRIFGFATGLAVLCAVWIVDRRLSRSLPLIGLALVGLNPEFVRWGDSIRAYGLGACLIVLTAPLVWAASVKPQVRRIAAASIASVASVQCLYNNVPLLAAVVAGCAAAALRRGEARRALIPVGIGAVAAISLVPYTVLIRRAAAWNMLCYGDAMPGMEVKTILAACGPIVFSAWIVLALAGLVAGGVALARRAGGASHGPAIFGGSTFAAAAVGYPLFLRMLHYQTKPWYYVPFLALLVVAAEAALPALSSRPGTRIARIVLAAAITAASLYPASDSLRARQTTIDAIASRLDVVAGPDDLIVVTPWYLGITFDRYYRGKTAWTSAPPLAAHSVHRFDLIKKQMTNPEAMSPVLSKMEQVLTAGGNVWIVGGVPLAGLPYEHLPPPPLPDSGWQHGPYTRLWGFQAWNYLKLHTVETEGVPIDVRAIDYERAGLIRASGWRP